VSVILVCCRISIPLADKFIMMADGITVR